MSSTLSILAVFVVVAAASASQPWLGRWESSESKQPENFDAVISALGLPVEKFGGNPKSILELRKEGDSYKSIFEVPSKNYKTELNFKLGEEGSHVEPKFGNIEIKYKYTEDGEKLLAEVKAPAKNKIIHDTYEVVGNELIKSYKVDGIVGKRYFNRA